MTAISSSVMPPIEWDTPIALFRHQVEQRPDWRAVSCNGQSISYAELDSESDALATALIDRGLGEGDNVGLYIGRSMALVVGVLGVMKSGATYVPVDPKNPVERNDYIARDSSIVALVTDGDTSTDLVPKGMHLTARSGADRKPPVAHRQTPSSIAYVIYTSGTTGQPKGVPIPASNIVSLLRSTSTLFDFHAGDVWTLFHSHAFDFSVWEMWGALATGGRLVVVPYWTARSPKDFVQLLETEQVTVLNQTPSAFSALLASDRKASAWDRELALRYIIFGGESLSGRTLVPWAERHGLDRPALVNMYGITETTVHATFHRVGEKDLDSAESTIGQPLPGVKIWLLDDKHQPVEDGKIGEIYVQGWLARGYLNRAELTAERFLEVPTGDGQTALMYRSGDLARRRADGSLVYLGRGDDQIKIRGYRIELGEIEATLKSLSSVREAVVWLADVPGEDRQDLVAAVIPSAPERFDDRQLRRQLRAALPSHMIPSRFVEVERIPLTVNGKADRKRMMEGAKVTT